MSLCMVMASRAADAPPDPGVTCAYPLDAQAAEIATVPPGGYVPLALDTAQQQGTLTLVGSTAQNAIAFPAGIMSGTGETIDLSTGKNVIGFRIVVPTAEAESGNYDVAIATCMLMDASFSAQAVNVQIRPRRINYTSTFSSKVTIGATEVYSLEAATVLGEYFWCVFDATAGTAAVYVDNSEVAVGTAQYTPGAYLAVLSAEEKTNSLAADAGKVVTVGLITDASLMPAHLASLSATDKCGSAI